MNARWTLAGPRSLPREILISSLCLLLTPGRAAHAFIASFSFVGKLAERSETAVYEEYLEWRWKSLANDLPEIGKPPSGKEAVALMRIVVAAQEETHLSAWILPCLQRGAHAAGQAGAHNGDGHVGV